MHQGLEPNAIALQFRSSEQPAEGRGELNEIQRLERCRKAGIFANDRAQRHIADAKWGRGGEKFFEIRFGPVQAMTFRKSPSESTSGRYYSSAPIPNVATGRLCGSPLIALCTTILWPWRA